MLSPVFSFQLGYQLFPHQVAIGRFYDNQLNIVGATIGGKVLVHNVKLDGTPTQGEVNLLNINQSICALAAGNIDPNMKRDVLAIGTSNSLLVYDINDNKDLFYKELPDGAFSIVFGRLGKIEQPMIIVGGSCVIYGYDMHGIELFWTVTGDKVSSMALLDFNNDGFFELVAASEDYDIRVFCEDQIIADISEMDNISALCALSGSLFVYALSNGTVGLYDGALRIWKIKTKSLPIVMLAYDINNDGEEEIITGWSGGKVDARRVYDGAVLMKDNIGQPIAGIVKGDYCRDGRELLVCCTNEGLVRAYPKTGQEGTIVCSDHNDEMNIIRELVQKKKDLQLELDNLKSLSHKASSKDNELFAILPKSAKFDIKISVVQTCKNGEPGGVQIEMISEEVTIIRSMLIFGEGMYSGECLVCHPADRKLTNKVVKVIQFPKDMPYEIYVRAFIGLIHGEHFLAIEQHVLIPKFSMFVFLKPGSLSLPHNSVTFIVKERINRVVLWLNENFLLSDQLKCETSLELEMLSVRNNQVLAIKFDADGTFVIRTDDIELAGELVQDLAVFLKLDQLSTIADFNIEFQRIAKSLEMANELKDSRQKFSSDIADISSSIASLIVRSEDARLMGNIKEMKKLYSELSSVNRELLASYQMRSNNHEQLTSCLRQVNQGIQKAANLRVGKYKTEVMNGCRDAIKNNDRNLLTKIMTVGVS